MSKDLRKALRHYIWHCPICKKETVHRCVFQELVACDVCDLVQHKPLKKLLETKDPCECPGCHQDFSAYICGEAT
jgi:hypothetical protein